MLLKNFLADELQVKKGSVKMPIKSLVDQYKERYEEMAQDTSRPFSYMVYRTTPGGRIIVHVKVPSRSLTKFYYDVLLELEPTDKATSIRDCHVKFFSNSPSFIYSYAYVFYHLDPGDSSTPKGRRSRSGMIIDTFTKKIPRDRLLMPGTEKKIGDKVLKNEPVVRNPLGLPYLDSSIYVAIFYLEDITTLPQILSQRNYRTESQIFNSVADFDKLMADRKRVALREKNQAVAKQKRENTEVRKVEKQVHKVNRGSQFTKPLKPIAPIRATKPTGIRKPSKPRTTRREHE